MARGVYAKEYSNGARKLGLRELRAFQKRHRKIALDTSVFIYQLENESSVHCIHPPDLQLD